ncbi:MAG: IclR family transcriptional regulator [Haloarculaceae archaeon]
MAKSEASSPVKTAGRVFDVIETLDDLDRGTLTEVAARLDVPRSTAYDHLTSMVDAGILVKEDKEYRLSLRFFQYGMHARENVGVSTYVTPKLEQLAEETGEITWYVVEENGKGVYLEKAEGSHAVQPYGKLGEHVHLHDIAAGKAILAQLPDTRVQEIIDRHGLPARTERTITSADALFEELAAIRERGVAFNDGEAMNRFRAVASPVVTDGTLHGSIVISGPENRLRGDRFRTELPERVAGTANAIELEILSAE